MFLFINVSHAIEDCNVCCVWGCEQHAMFARQMHSPVKRSCTRSVGRGLRVLTGWFSQVTVRSSGMNYLFHWNLLVFPQSNWDVVSYGSWLRRVKHWLDSAFAVSLSMQINLLCVGKLASSGWLTVWFCRLPSEAIVGQEYHCIIWLLWGPAWKTVGPCSRYKGFRAFLARIQSPQPAFVFVHLCALVVGSTTGGMCFSETLQHRKWKFDNLQLMVEKPSRFWMWKKMWLVLQSNSGSPLRTSSKHCNFGFDWFFGKWYFATILVPEILSFWKVEFLAKLWDNGVRVLVILHGNTGYLVNVKDRSMHMFSPLVPIYT